MSKDLFYNRYSTTPLSKVADYVNDPENHYSIERDEFVDRWDFIAKYDNNRKYQFTVDVRDSAEDMIVHISMRTGYYIKDNSALSAILLRSNARKLDNRSNPPMACISDEDGEIEIRKSIELDKHSDIELYEAELDCFYYLCELDKKLKKLTDVKAADTDAEFYDDINSFDDSEESLNVASVEGNIKTSAKNVESNERLNRIFREIDGMIKR